MEPLKWKTKQEKPKPKGRNIFDMSLQKYLEGVENVQHELKVLKIRIDRIMSTIDNKIKDMFENYKQLLVDTVHTILGELPIIYIEWDGVVGDNQVIQYDGSDYYKVSDFVFSNTQLKQCVVVAATTLPMPFNGAGVQLQTTETENEVLISCETTQNGATYTLDNIAMVVKKGNPEIRGLYFKVNFIYVSLLSNFGVSSGVSEDTVKRLIAEHGGSGGTVVSNTPLISDVFLAANKWSGSNNLFSQVVTINGATANSQIDLTPSAEQLAIFYQKDLTFVTENNNGVITVYAIGQKPLNDYTIQVTITEVDYA